MRKIYRIAQLFATQVTATRRHGTCSQPRQPYFLSLDRASRDLDDRSAYGTDSAVLLSRTDTQFSAFPCNTKRKITHYTQHYTEEILRR